MKTCMHIFRHELQKILGDKKLLASMVVLPLIIVFITSFLSGTDPQAQAQKSRIYALDGVLPEQSTNAFKIVSVEQKTLPQLLETVELRAEDAVLQVSGSAAVIYYNSANAASVSLSNLCRQLLADQALAKFAVANTVDLSGRIVLKDLSAKQSGGNALLAIMIPYMLVLLLFQSASEFATDTIAGEKERGVFSKTLLTPHNPTPIICGKLLSSTLCGLSSSAVYILIVVGVSWVTGVDSYGLLSAELAPGEVALMVFCAVLLSCLFASIAVMCSLYAADTKGARSMRLPVYGVTMALALLAMLRMGTVSWAYYAIPIYNICLMMQDVLSSALEAGKMLVTVLSLGACTVAVVTVTVMSFKKEEIRC